MFKPSSFAVAALVLSSSCTSGALAYSGDLMGDSASGGSAPSIVFEFDGNHAKALAAASEGPTLDNPNTADADTGGQIVHDDARVATSPQQPHDDFQRYFDQHYRAHPVLNASAHLLFKVD